MIKADIQFVRSLAEKRVRDQERLFVAEGSKLTEEILASKFVVRRIYTTRTDLKGKNIEVVDQREMERIWSKGNTILFDVDVMGGINLKHIFGEQACSIFIMPPSIQELEKRLIGRATDSPETIAKRIAKAEFELSKSEFFDHVVINDDLAEAVAETRHIIESFIRE